MMTEIMRQPQDSRHVTAADFRGRFANLAIELRHFLDDQHAGIRVFAFEHQRRRRAGKSAADDDHIIIKIHRDKENGLCPLQTQLSSNP